MSSLLSTAMTRPLTALIGRSQHPDQHARTHLRTHDGAARARTHDGFAARCVGYDRQSLRCHHKAQPAPKRRSHKRPKDRTREPARQRLCRRLHSCPITLDAFSSLRYPPFELKANPTLPHKTSGDWFDGRALAAYLCATGTFTHPLSRRVLDRSECVDLDAHLVRHRLGQRRAAHEFDNGPRDLPICPWMSP